MTNNVNLKTKRTSFVFVFAVASIILFLFAFVSCDQNSFAEVDDETFAPFGLKYSDVSNAREVKGIVTAPPTVQTGGLLPLFEIVSVRDSDGNLLDDSYLSSVSIGGPKEVSLTINPDEDGVRLDENGNPIEEVNTLDTRENGVIKIDSDHIFETGEYFFTIKVTTQSVNGQEYSTVFDDVFKLSILPLLPEVLIYSPKNQNLVVGDADGKTTNPILPNANPEVRYELGSNTNDLDINEDTGVVTLSSSYNYTVYDTITPTINVVSKISGEVSSFEDVLTVIITDTPVTVPRENIYFFYPTLKTSGSFPTSGNGFSVQVDIEGNGQDIWGAVDNSTGKFLAAPDERPAENTDQTVLETQIHSGTVSKPTASWMITKTQDLTPFEFGYDLSFNYYYQPAFQLYLGDGRTPSDLEVYYSTDYTGGDIQDKDGNWLNGTWTQVNADMKCNRSLGTASGRSSGAPWGPEFIGTPYPGDQSGPDPDGRKVPGTTFYNKWVRCSYDIPASEISSTFTVAFKVATYFEGELLRTAEKPGRGGIFFFSDFHYKAAE